jgi:hypothetical protein
MAMAMVMAMAGSWGLLLIDCMPSACPAIACGGNKETESAAQDRKRSASGWTDAPTDPQQGRAAGQDSGAGQQGRAAGQAGHLGVLLVCGPHAVVCTPQQRTRIGHECRF